MTNMKLQKRCTLLQLGGGVLVLFDAALLCARKSFGFPLRFFVISALRATGAQPGGRN
jgi:hypothetical protein